MSKSQQLKSLWLTFFIWWTESILLLLPIRMQQMVKPMKDRLIIKCDEGRVCFHFIRRQQIQGEVEKYICPLDDDIEVASARNWLNNKIATTTEIILQFPHNKILLKELSLPLATKENLRQVLNYEIDRHTPFDPEQAYFDYFMKSNADNDKLLVWFYITPRTHIDQSLEKIKVFNILPDLANSNELLTSRSKLNFLPTEKRRLQNDRKNKSLWFLSFATSLLFLAVLYLPVIQLYQQTHILQAEIDQYRKKAIETKKIQEQKDNLLLQSDFLLIKQKEYFPVISLLDELTQILPNDTWLSGLSITPHNVQIQGESDNASSIIEIIESSDQLHNASFISPITKNKTGDKDKFKLSAKLDRKSL